MRKLSYIITFLLLIVGASVYSFYEWNTISEKDLQELSKETEKLVQQEFLELQERVQQELIQSASRLRGISNMKDLERTFIELPLEHSLLHRDNSPLIWKGFIPDINLSPEVLPFEDRVSLRLREIEKQFLLEFTYPIDIDQPSTLNISSYIYLSNASVSKILAPEFENFTYWKPSTSIPLQFTFPPNLKKQQGSPLVSIHDDTLGWVQINTNLSALHEYRTAKEKSFWLTPIFSLSTILLFFLVLFETQAFPLAKRLGIRIGFYAFFGLIYTFLSPAEPITDFMLELGLRVPRNITVLIMELLFSTTLFTLVGIEISYASYYQKRWYGISWYPRTIVLSLVLGVLLGFTFTSLPLTYLSLLSQNEISFFDISVLPTLETLLYTVGIGITYSILFLATILSLAFLFSSEQDQISWVHPIVWAGFISTLSIKWLLGSFELYSKQLLVGIALVFLVVYVIAYLHYLQPYRIRYVSRVRLLTLGSLILTAILFPLIVTMEAINERSTLETTTQRLVEDQQAYSIPIWRQSTPTSKNKGYWPGKCFIAVYDSDSGDLLAFWNNDIGLGIPPITPPDTSNGSRFKTATFNRNQYLVRYERNNDIYLVSMVVRPGWSHYVFSFFRLYFVFILLFIALSLLRVASGNTKLIIFDARERLQSRILDTYILASVLFLIVLTGATALIVREEENRISSENLLSLNKEIQTTISEELLGSLTQPTLQYLSQRFNVTLTVYKEARPWLTTRTSYRSVPKYLAPYEVISKQPSSAFPVTIYHSYDRETLHKTLYSPLTIANSGEKTILRIENTVQSDQYNNQLLQTTSTLISVYGVIFGIFILASFFISKYLAAPLQKLLNGLKRISSGRLDTIVPVTTSDEIGELANAYNFMIFRLKDLQKELADAERQAAWSEMARQIAHEIKNPLTPMKLSVQHLQHQVVNKNTDFDNVRPVIQRISSTLIEQIDTLSSIATDFSRFAQLSNEFETLDLNTIVLSTNELYRHDKHIHISIDVHSEPLPIFANGDELKRVLINLVKNSIEAMPKGGTIIIRCYPYKSNAFIEVVDNGEGVPVEKQSDIFKPNFSTKTSGTGLGLAICKRVIESHKGSISFASVPGSGTTFTLSLPLVHQNVPKPLPD